MMPFLFIRLFATFRFISLSSTTSTLAPCAKRYCFFSLRSVLCFSRSARSPTGSSSMISCSSSKENAEPCPYSLSTFKVLPIRSNSLVTMDIPSPVPSMFRFLVSSSRAKDSKSLSLSSSRMPIPVSRTQTASRNSPSAVRFPDTVSVTLPSSVYFTALVSRFMITCRMRTSSPNSLQGMVLSMSRTNSSPLFFARSAMELTRSLIMEETSYFTGTSSILPSSILEKSSMLLISDSSVLPADWMLTAYSLISGSSDSRSIISFMPRTALIGVRISWDICARKELFAFPADIAASADCFNSLFVFSCQRKRPVRSR